MLTTTTTLTTSAMMLRLDRRLRLERPPVLDHPDHHLVCRLVCLDRIKEVCARHMMIQVYGHALVLQPQSHARTSVIATMIATIMLMKTKHFVQHGPTLVLGRAVPCLDHQGHFRVARGRLEVNLMPAIRAILSSAATIANAHGLSTLAKPSAGGAKQMFLAGHRVLVFLARRPTTKN